MVQYRSESGQDSRVGVDTCRQEPALKSITGLLNRQAEVHKCQADSGSTNRQERLGQTGISETILETKNTKLNQSRQKQTRVSKTWLWNPQQWMNASQHMRAHSSLFIWSMISPHTKHLCVISLPHTWCARHAGNYSPPKPRSVHIDAERSGDPQARAVANKACTSSKGWIHSKAALCYSAAWKPNYLRSVVYIYIVKMITNFSQL